MAACCYRDERGGCHHAQGAGLVKSLRDYYQVMECEFIGYACASNPSIARMKIFATLDQS